MTTTNPVTITATVQPSAAREGTWSAVLSCDGWPECKGGVVLELFGAPTGQKALEDAKGAGLRHLRRYHPDTAPGEDAVRVEGATR